jgi:hypothetical protein
MLTRHILLLVALSLVLVRPMGSATAPTPDFQKINKSVLRVSAEGCQGRQPQLATGFVWHSPKNLVTAFHVVAGCSSLSVKYGNSATVWPASIDRVLIKGDLALLSIVGAPDLPMMSNSDATLQNDQDLWAWGFQEGAPTPSERKMQKLEGGKRLRDYVSDAVANDIKASGMPDPDIDVLYVNSLVNGLSGAPIFDMTGAVVGVGDGGLNGGSVGVNWALPEKYLKELLQSTDNKNRAGQTNVHQFSYDQPSDAKTAANIDCGGTTFIQGPSVTLQNAMLGTDSPSGLQQLMNVFPVGNPGSVGFSVYQDRKTGATFVLPPSAIVISTTLGCSASLTGIPITFYIEVRHYFPGNLDAAMAERTKFDLDVLTQNPPGIWSADLNWTSPPAYPRFDDFAARRVSWIKTAVGSPLRLETAFTTTAIKRGTFLGITARTPSAYLADPQAIRNWGTAVLAVHLATFPIG